MTKTAGCTGLSMKTILVKKGLEAELEENMKPIKTDICNETEA